MAGKNAGAGCGCLGLLVFVAMCTSAMTDGGSGSSYSSSSSSTYPTSTGWTESSYTATAGEREQQEWFYIHGTMNVRAEPSTDARIVRTLRHGDRVQLGPADANGWARSYSAGSPEGYVYRASENVRTGPPASQLSSGGRASGSGQRRSSGGRQLHVGPRGGCYYINRNGNKTYVDRSECY